MKYKVIGHATVVCSMIVEADSKEEAIENANEEFGSLTNYVGMGETDKLIGVCSSDCNRSISPDSDVEFDDCIRMD